MLSIKILQIMSKTKMKMERVKAIRDLYSQYTNICNDKVMMFNY